MMAIKPTNSKGTHYVDWEFMTPAKYKGKIFQLPVSPWKHALKSDVGQDRKHVWSVHKLLDTTFSEPKTLEDIGLTMTTVEQVHQSVLNIWSGVSTSASIPDDADSPPDTTNPGGKDFSLGESGPFADTKSNEIWRVLASQMVESHRELADIDMLEPNPTNQQQAMKHNRL